VTSTSQRSGDGRKSASRSPAEVARRALQQLAELVGSEPERVIGLERAEDGWRIEIEIVETRRIPDTADVLAVYEVEADAAGRLMGYHRSQRYQRGRASGAP
jgi:hypothetical protein